MDGSSIVPCGNIFAIGILIKVIDGMLGGCVGIHDSLDQRIAGQSVTAVQTRAGALAHSIQALDA